MFNTSPGPMRSVGGGGKVRRVELGSAAGGGSCEALVTSTNWNGSCALALPASRAACSISWPVGPLSGNVEQAARANRVGAKSALRCKARRAHRLLIIIEDTLGVLTTGKQVAIYHSREANGNARQPTPTHAGNWSVNVGLTWNAHINF